MSAVVLLGAAVMLVLVPPLRPDSAAAAPAAFLRRGVRVIAAGPRATIAPHSFRDAVTGDTRIRRDAPAPCGAWSRTSPPSPLDVTPRAARSPP